MTAQPDKSLFDRYYPYLLEVRRRLLFVIALFAITTFLGFLYSEQIVSWTLRLLDLRGVNIVFTSPFQFFSLAVNSGLAVGLVVVLPLLLYQLIAFLRPALSPVEYKVILVCLPLAILLFLGGFAFGLSVMKYIITIFYQKSVELNIGNILDIEVLLSQTLLTASFMGMAFQFPIVITVLLRLGIVKFSTFAAQRPTAYLLALLFIIFLPPTDLVTDLILILPLIVLFELTLAINWFLLKPRHQVSLRSP